MWFVASAPPPIARPSPIYVESCENSTEALGMTFLKYPEGGFGSREDIPENNKHNKQVLSVYLLAGPVCRALSPLSPHSRSYSTNDHNCAQPANEEVNDKWQ